MYRYGWGVFVLNLRLFISSIISFMSFVMRWNLWSGKGCNLYRYHHYTHLMCNASPEGTTMTGIFPKTDYPNDNLHGFPQIVKTSSVVLYMAIYKRDSSIMIDWLCVCVLSSENCIHCQCLIDGVNCYVASSFKYFYLLQTIHWILNGHLLMFTTLAYTLTGGHNTQHSSNSSDEST